ncbi:methyltransferase domain-containing protein [Marisediminicola senii]|uniref:methyltransferase domain-containing protein n=1 Tax=Marisediminicola senii TaxID=2711233 RepID=UPI0013EA29AB|nr:methyltransferase domain-containing protein [Marisediminicola senii]
MSDAREQYTHGHHESVLRSHSWRTVENSAAYLLPYLAQGSSVLDVGSGPGTITVDLASRVQPAPVIGVDASAEVVAKAAVLGAAIDNVSFVTGDAYALPVDDHSVDVVHAHQVLQHVADPVAVLREFRRAVRHDGVAAARDVDYAAVAWYPLLPGLDRWMSVYRAVHRANGGEPDAGRRLKSWALEAGFTDVHATASVWCFSTSEDRDWWGGTWAIRALESGFASDALSLGLATADDLREISDAWLEWSQTPDATFIMPHGEIIARG